MTDIIKEKGVTSSDQLLKQAKQNLTRQKGLDDTWRLEHALVTSMAGSDAENRLMDKLSLYLPHKDKPMEITTSLQHLEQYIGSEEFKMIPMLLQSQVKLVLGFIKTLASEGQHDVRMQHRSNILRMVHRAAGSYLRWKEEGTKGPGWRRSYDQDHRALFKVGEGWPSDRS